MKTRIAVTWLFLTLIPGLALSASPQIDPGKEADIRRLLEATGASKLGATMGAQMAEQIKPLLMKALPPGERSQKIVDTFIQKLLLQANAEEFTKRVIPIYDKHLTDEDIKGLIQFYESPLGRRVVQVLPVISQESFTAGAQWGQQLSQEVLRQMQEEYPELKNLK